MTFIHPLLLGGLLLAGIPVLLHLIMRQKPKVLPFPAFRFLLLRHRTNQRKLRLRHLLLLALRILLIALVCLALARPKVFNEGLGLGSQQPVAAVLLFDTSFSMEYTAGGRTRLDEAKGRALELLQELPEGSRVAVLDSTVDPAEPSGEWLTPTQARERIELLRTRPNNGPVTGRLADAYRLLADLENEQGGSEQPLPRFLYVFSDRTEGAWDGGRVKDLAALRDRAAGVNAVLVDVGADNPTNVAITDVKPRRQVLAQGQDLVVDVTVRAVSADCVNVLKCRIGDAVDQKEVRLAAGQSQVFTFERAGLPQGFHRIEVTLGTSDALPFDNARFATAEVRGGRNVLVIADNPDDAAVWELALEVGKVFLPQVVSTADVGKLDNLATYQAVCLLNVADPARVGLWPLLERYVDKGGGLVVIPGGSELQPRAYNDDPTARKLLPGRLIRIVTWPAETYVDWNWDDSIFRHPLLKPYQEDRRRESTDFVRHPRGADIYWEVEPDAEHGAVLVRYADAERRPAILETASKTGRGRVLLFTTKLDGDKKWNNYLESVTSFYLALARRTCGYLAGDAEETQLNFHSGQLVTVPLPLASRQPNYTVRGPGLTGTLAIVTRREDQGELEIPQAVAPGGYVVVAKGDQSVAQFSVNIPPEESLLSRLPAEQIEELFGPGAVVPVDKRTNLREALQNRWGQPVELLPWLMILVLLALAVENLLANKFYRQEPAEDPAAV